MDTYIVLITLLGVIILLTAWLPMVLRKLPLSLPILAILLGVAFSTSSLSPVVTNPLENKELTKRLCEFVVIVALMGAGLKLDRRIGWRRWKVTWRLLGIAMPLTIAGIALIAATVLNVPIASAILLGAVLAPTDPVLASDIQVGPPSTGNEDEVRFSLTSEAGLNDGLSFPFVYLAIAVAAAPTFGVMRGASPAFGSVASTSGAISFTSSDMSCSYAKKLRAFSMPSTSASISSLPVYRPKEARQVEVTPNLCNSGIAQCVPARTAMP